MQTIFYKICFLLLSSLLSVTAYSQQTSQQTYPKITGYVGIVHPIINFSDGEFHANFHEAYIVGMPIGINIWKTSKIGFSSEIVPFIRANSSTSKVSNVLFHPGVVVALGKGFTFAGRVAFETSGRYGFTPVLNKVVKKNKGSNFFAAIPLPARFGNDLPSSFSAGFQFGIAF